MNYVKTILLLLGLSLILIWAGSLLGGAKGAVLAFVFSLVLNGVTYWFSDKIVLAMYRAKELSRQEFPRIYDIVEKLSVKAGIPCPKVYMAEAAAPNAFATGRDPKHAALCLTSGIMNMLDEEELSGVISHELAHIRNHDTLIMTIAAAMASAIMMLANMARWAAFSGGTSRGKRDSSLNAIAFLVIGILAPLAAMLVQLAISRSREYAADATGAKVSGRPLDLARALEDMTKVSKTYRLEASPQTAHLFIVNPLSGNFLANMFSTHPPIQERVKRLKAMA